MLSSFAHYGSFSVLRGCSQMGAAACIPIALSLGYVVNHSWVHASCKSFIGVRMYTSRFVLVALQRYAPRVAAHNIRPCVGRRGFVSSAIRAPQPLADCGLLRAVRTTDSLARLLEVGTFLRSTRECGDWKCFLPFAVDLVRTGLGLLPKGFARSGATLSAAGMSHMDFLVLARGVSCLEILLPFFGLARLGASTLWLRPYRRATSRSQLLPP